MDNPKHTALLANAVAVLGDIAVNSDNPSYVFSRAKAAVDSITATLAAADNQPAPATVSPPPRDELPSDIWRSKDKVLNLTAMRDKLDEGLLYYGSITGNGQALAENALIAGRLDVLIRRELQFQRNFARRFQPPKPSA